MLDLVFKNTLQAIQILMIASFIINIIVQLTKNIGILKKIPTNLYVIILSIIICEFMYFGFASYLNIEVLWYEIGATFFASFAVAYSAMFGFDKLKTTWESYKIKLDNSESGKEW